jgi:maltoporin
MIKKELKIMKKLPLAIAVSAAILSSNVMAELAPVEFHGYFRAGVGISGDSGQQVAYEKANLGRLGNEDDVYSEIQLSKEIAESNGITFKVNSMLAIISNGSNDFESTDDKDANFALRQFNVEAKGALGGDEVIFAGKRFNQRHDVHITDFYYWDISGAGAGIENLAVGPGKLSAMWVRSDRAEVADAGNNGGALNVNIFDARYAGLELWRDASLEVGIDYAVTNKSSSFTGTNPKDGVMLTAEVTQSLLGGFNKTALQYGTEGFGGAIANGGSGNGYGAEAEDGASAFRILNHGVVSFGDKVDFAHMIRYSEGADVEAGQSDDITNFSVVIRPEYKWNDNNKTILELGTYMGTNADGSDVGGQKYTIAQALTAGSSFWARPEIRVYASYLTDSETESFANNTSDSEYNLGVQAEAWF